MRRGQGRGALTQQRHRQRRVVGILLIALGVRDRAAPDQIEKSHRKARRRNVRRQIAPRPQAHMLRAGARQHRTADQMRLFVAPLKQRVHQRMAIQKRSQRAVAVVQQRAHAALQVHRAPLEDAFEPLLQRRADQRHHQKQKDHANAHFERFGIQHVVLLQASAAFICKKVPMTVGICADYYIFSGFAHCQNGIFFRRLASLRNGLTARPPPTPQTHWAAGESGQCCLRASSSAAFQSPRQSAPGLAQASGSRRNAG